jgi:kynurenine formamidase
MLIDLSQYISESMPYSSNFPAPCIDEIRNVDEDGINIQQYCLNTHLGTHLDAPRHFIPDGKTIDKVDLDRVSGTAVVLDVTKHSPQPITVKDVKQATCTVCKSDIVLLYTGWSEKYGSEEYEPHPWMTVDLAQWFVEKGVNLVALDVITPDIPWSHRPDDWSDFPVHRELLGNDVLVAENLANMESITGRRVEVYGYPIKISGGDGAPVRFVAKI